MADPIDKAEESLSKFGEVAAAIADCDEKHPVIQLYHISQTKQEGADPIANQADTNAIPPSAGYKISTQNQG